MEGTSCSLTRRYAESHLGVTPDRALAVIFVLNRRNILTD
jgi:hypothetical protein